MQSKFASKLSFITLNFACKDCKVFIGTSCIFTNCTIPVAKIQNFPASEGGIIPLRHLPVRAIGADDDAPPNHPPNVEHGSTPLIPTQDCIDDYSGIFYSCQFIKSFRPFHSFWEEEDLPGKINTSFTKWHIIISWVFSFRVIQPTVRWHTFKTVMFVFINSCSS